MNELQDEETKGWKLRNFLFPFQILLVYIFGAHSSCLLLEAILKHVLSSPHFTWQANKEWRPVK